MGVKTWLRAALVDSDAATVDPSKLRVITMSKSMERAFYCQLTPEPQSQSVLVGAECDFSEVTQFAWPLVMFAHYYLILLHCKGMWQTPRINYKKAQDDASV